MPRKYIIALVVVVVAVLSGVLFFTTRSSAPSKVLVGPAGSFNVKNYGAYGDGKHNDEAAILKTITTAGGKVVFFPAGNYLVTKTFILPPAAVVKGEGDQYSEAGAAKQSRLMVVTQNADGTASWSFRWILP